jgi:uncharacterized protein
MIDNFRAVFARMMRPKGNRNTWHEFGYPEAVTPDDYWKRYRRDGIANRIIKSYPQSCWRNGASVRDDAGGGTTQGQRGYSQFAAAWWRLQEDYRVYHYLERADRLARVGQYSLLCMGFADGQPLDTPLDGQHALTYLAAYPEYSVTIDVWDSDGQSPRYGLPVIYTVKTDSLSDRGDRQVIPKSSFRVHYSRVLHVSEGRDDNDVFGEPSLRAPWNYLLDLEKVVGSSAETFWLNARAGLAIEAATDNTGMAAFSEEQIDAMRKQAEEYENQLRRIMAFEGAQVKMLTTNVADPKPNIETLQALIAGTTAIPQRILFGSERGELASTQDENSWESRIDERRRQHCGPNILAPFVTKMLETGNLIAPQGDWWIEWPEASASSPEKEAEIALKRAQAAAAYTNSQADTIISPQEFRPMIGLEAESDFDLSEPLDADTLE